MKISVIQMNMLSGETRYNYSHARELLTEAVKTSPDVVILPETWNTGFFPKENLSEYADTNGEKAKELLSSISREYKVSIIGGSVTEKRADGIYNTCFIYNDKGENIDSYSKTHLFSPMGENEFYKAGDKICVFEICGVKAAVIICYDLRFPELSRRLALSGANLLFVPSQWPEERLSQMEILLKGRAVENQMFVISANSCGTFSDTVYGGNSLFIDPLGNVLARAGAKEEILTVDIDISRVKNIRSSINIFSDRREELY